MPDPPNMNTANESLQPNRTLPRTYALPMLLKKNIAVIWLALIGIGFIIWLDNYMNHADMHNLSRDIRNGMLIQTGFLVSFH